MRSVILAAVLTTTASPALAVTCGGDFGTFIALFATRLAQAR